VHLSSTGNPLSALNVQPASAFCTHSKYSGSFEQSVVGEAVGDSVGEEVREAVGDPVATGEGVATGDSVGEAVGGGQSCSLG
jgi:hypothetical protein